MPPVLSVSSFSPTPIDSSLIPKTSSLKDVFSIQNQKTPRTFWVDLIYNEKVWRVECKRILNPASLAADRIRRFIGKNPVWIPCNLLLKEDGNPQAIPIAVFIKSTPFFNPRVQTIYHLPPPIFIEGSGKDIQLPGLFYKAYHEFFQRLQKPPGSRAIVAEPIQSSDNPDYFYNFLTWSNSEFVIDLCSPLGSGATKSASLALRVEVITPYHFRVSKRALIKPKSGYEKIVTFQLPHLKELSHPNIGIPDPRELRYRWIGLNQTKIRKWYRLTYLGKDLHQAAPQIKTQSRLYNIFFQMVAGVNYLLKNEYMHDDLKPANWILYTNDEGDDVVKLEDCDSIRKITTGFTRRKPMQTIWYLPTHLRKSILDVMSQNMSLTDLGNSSFAQLWRMYNFEYEELFAASTNILGYSLAEIYLVFRQNHIIEADNKSTIESLIGKLANHPIRDPAGRRPYNILAYLQMIDSTLQKVDPGAVLEETIEALPPLDDVSQTISDLYTQVIYHQNSTINKKNLSIN